MLLPSCSCWMLPRMYSPERAAGAKRCVTQGRSMKAWFDALKLCRRYTVNGMHWWMGPLTVTAAWHMLER